MKFLTLFLFTAIFGESFSQDYLVNESVLYQFVKAGEAPSLQQIESALLESQNQKLRFEDQFKTSAFSQGSYVKTKEEAIISFQPVFSPASDLALGAKRSLKHGIQLSASIGAANREFLFGGVQTSKTISLARVSANIDLWKNLMGRITKAQSQTLDLGLKSARLQKSVRTQIFLNNLRMLYWQLVSNDEQIQISKKLLESAYRQERESLERLKNSVADKGEVARYRAQVATRQSQLTSLKFQKQQIVRTLRELLPELNGKTITLGKLTLDNTIDNVLQCVGMLKSIKETPLQFSLYDDLNLLLNSLQNNQVKIAESYSSAGFFLKTGIQTSAVNDNTSGAFDEALNEEREGYSIGLQLNIPIGLNDTKNQLVKAEKIKTEYQVKRNLANLLSASVYK